MPYLYSTQWKLPGLLALAGIAVIAAFSVDPVPQDPAYHQFADQRTLLGIPNFWNVMTNIPFLFIGAAGMLASARRASGSLPDLLPAYFVFFAGVFLVAFGSGWYHLVPSNSSLVWDRLPMTLSFMAFFTALIGENISLRWGKLLLWPLLCVGLFSVFYWIYTEEQGRGDLRLYGLVQFLPMLLIPIILLTFRSSLTEMKWIWFAGLAYLAAKLVEFWDTGLYVLLGFSGHSIKHLLAALGAYFVLLALTKRCVNKTGI
jgi:hypothetical protein